MRERPRFRGPDFRDHGVGREMSGLKSPTKGVLFLAESVVKPMDLRAMDFPGLWRLHRWEFALYFDV